MWNSKQLLAVIIISKVKKQACSFQFWYSKAVADALVLQVLSWSGWQFQGPCCESYAVLLLVPQSINLCNDGVNIWPGCRTDHQHRQYQVSQTLWVPDIDTDQTKSGTKLSVRLSLIQQLRSQQQNMQHTLHQNMALTLPLDFQIPTYMEISGSLIFSPRTASAILSPLW